MSIDEYNDQHYNIEYAYYRIFPIWKKIYHWLHYLKQVNPCFELTEAKEIVKSIKTIDQIKTHEKILNELEESHKNHNSKRYYPIYKKEYKK